MKRKRKKKPTATKVDWVQLLIQAAIDFTIGLLLLIADRLIK